MFSHPEFRILNQFNMFYIDFRWVSSHLTPTCLEYFSKNFLWFGMCWKMIIIMASHVWIWFSKAMIFESLRITSAIIRFMIYKDSLDSCENCDRFCLESSFSGARFFVGKLIWFISLYLFTRMILILSFRLSHFFFLCTVFVTVFSS